MVGMVVITLATLQLVLPLLDIWDWLAAAFLCSVLLLVLRLVSVRSPLVRFACRWLCSSSACRWLALLCSWLCSSCCWLCSSRFFSPLLQIFDVLLAVLVPLLLYFVLLTTGSLVVVLSPILTTCSLAVVPSVFLLQSLFVVGYDTLARFWLPPTSLLSVAPFVIDGSR